MHEGGGHLGCVHFVCAPFDRFSFPALSSSLAGLTGLIGEPSGVVQLGAPRQPLDGMETEASSLAVTYRSLLLYSFLRLR